MHRNVGTLSVRDLDGDDGPDVERLLERAADFFSARGFADVGAAEAQSLFIGLPEGADYSQKKLLGCFRGGTLIAVLDMILKHPGAYSATIAFVLVETAARGRGAGSALIASAVEVAKAASCTTLEADVPNSDSSFGFWLAREFTASSPDRVWLDI